MTLIVDSFRPPVDSRIDPAAARCLRGGFQDKTLEELVPGLYVAPFLLETMSGRIAALAPLIPSGHCVTANTAIWIFTGQGCPSPIHTRTTSRRSFSEICTHRCTVQALSASVKVHGLRIALPQRARLDLEKYSEAASSDFRAEGASPPRRYFPS